MCTSAANRSRGDPHRASPRRDLYAEIDHARPVISPLHHLEDSRNGRVADAIAVGANRTERREARVGKVQVVEIRRCPYPPALGYPGHGTRTVRRGRGYRCCKTLHPGAEPAREPCGTSRAQGLDAKTQGMAVRLDRSAPRSRSIPPLKPNALNPVRRSPAAARAL